MELSTGELSSVSESEDQRRVLVGADDPPAASPVVFCLVYHRLHATRQFGGDSGVGANPRGK
jgi:hypothetical protein